MPRPAARSRLEALLRWDHPTRGRLAPDLFIPLAEETGLIVEIGNWVLEEALTQLAALASGGADGSAAFASRSTSQPPARCAGACREDGPRFASSRSHRGAWEWSSLRSVLLDDGYPASTLQALRDLGVHILLDDFGTGYSSLAYLEKFPIDTLKIDRSFVARLEEGEERGAVLRAIFAMASALGLEAIAEGVETAEQLRQLRDLGCRWIQGYVVARPMPVAKVLAFLAEQATLSSAVGGSGGGA